jgi:hypothetical protein
MPSDQRTWHHIEAAMMNNPLQEPAGDFVSRLDKIVKDDVNYFKVDQSPDNSVVQEVSYIIDTKTIEGWLTSNSCRSSPGGPSLSMIRMSSIQRRLIRT